MNRRIDQVSLCSELFGGMLLLLTACASDAGLALHQTLMAASISLLLLGFGVLGRELCSKRGRAFRQKLAVMRLEHHSAVNVFAIKKEFA